METVLQQFDDSYSWGGNNPVNSGQPGLPGRMNGQPKAGLRDLYCYWIDRYLQGIENLGEQWLTTSRANYAAEYKQ